MTKLKVHIILSVAALALMIAGNITDISTLQNTGLFMASATLTHWALELFGGRK